MNTVAPGSRTNTGSGGSFIRGLLALLAVIVGADLRAAATAGGPNVILFYADDLGWGELGCQGNPEIPTPHIDAIARDGVRFTQGYVAATYCSPSRAGLLTGRYPTRFGHEFNSVALQSGLRLDQKTIADRLKPLGYATACVGKWHLGGGLDYRPTRRGFDEFFGTLNNTPFFHPTNFVDSRLSEAVRGVTDPAFYTTDAFAERSVDWLEGNREKRWFLYLPFNAQHAPLQAPRKYLERFPGITDARRKLFAGMLAAMDDAVGRVMAKVRELGQEENTLVFFISDNGGPTQSTTSKNGVLRGYKMTTYEGGPRVPFLAQWKGRWPAGKTYDLPVINLDVLPTILAAAGATIDPAWGLDGVDLTPYVMGGKTGRPHQTLYWRYGPQWAVRHGDYKLVVSRGGSAAPELYNLAVDVRESNNLATRQPRRVKELQALWDKWNVAQEAASAPDAPSGKAKKSTKTAKKKQPAR